MSNNSQQLPPIPKGFLRIVASDGSVHDVPVANIEKALEIDPGLTVWSPPDTVQTEAHADYVCAHCGHPVWAWDGEEEYTCPNGCCTDAIPSTTILRPWDDKLDEPATLNLTAADCELLRAMRIAP